ncbi:hypothetical protein GCM10010994_09330 [Chelatococcus reniformis]|uniref:Uncharacterized protein n=1 Tax=Chelatococcus reniformis TaxID=1494448 RepID=A0A916TZA5_9HYPH|nr:hypothetical protein GCM10010994_09330 [Chelatococcus reniformis]
MRHAAAPIGTSPRRSRRWPRGVNAEDFVLTEEELAWLMQPVLDKAA